MTTELVWRLGSFTLFFICLSLLELLIPRRPLKVSKAYRWTQNIGLMLLNTIVVRFIFPVGAVGISIYANSHQVGLLNLYSIKPDWLIIVSSVILLDFLIYLQHVLFHKIPILWRLHRVHHADVDLDVTSGTRFHTIEIILSMIYKAAVIVALGIPASAVLVFEIILNCFAMFNHSNIFIPLKLDRVLRLVLVTPEMHRIHHSLDRAEVDTNYGFNLPWWDYFFGTYTDLPKVAEEKMPLGERGSYEKLRQSLGWLLGYPFLK